jgi:hypothetical protein
VSVLHACRDIAERVMINSIARDIKDCRAASGLIRMCYEESSAEFPAGMEISKSLEVEMLIQIRN